MKNHDELIKSVFEKGEAAIAEQKKRSAVIRRTVFSVSGICAAAVIGYGVWNSDILRNSLTPDPDSQFPVSEPTTAVTTAETTSAPVSTRSTETKNTTTTAQTTDTTPDTTATSVINSTAATSVSAERTTSSETTTASAAATTTSRITTASTATNTTASTATTTQDWEAGGNEGGGGWGGGYRTTTTTTATTVTKNTTIPSHFGPYCRCTITEQLSGIYYSTEEEVTLDSIGERIDSVYIDICYANGYKGYDMYTARIKGTAYEYSEDKIAVRYGDCEEYYLYYKVKEV